MVLRVFASLCSKILPAAIAKEPDRRHRAHLVIALVFVYAMIGPLFIFIEHYLYGASTAAFITAAMTAVAIAATLGLRFGLSLELVAVLLCTEMTGSVILLAVSVQGLSASALGWFVCAPLFAVLLSGRRAGLMTAFVNLAAILIIYYLSRQGAWSQSEMSMGERRYAAMWNTTLLLGVVTICGLLYESLRLRAISALSVARVELNATREQNQVSERMASLGTLAAGVAHEINNPMTYVMANLEYARQQVDALRRDRNAPVDFNDWESALSEAMSGAARVRDIVRELKTFSRSDDSARGVVDVLTALNAAVRMVANELRHHAKLSTDMQAVPLVKGNEYQLCQVFLNLLTNALQAMPENRDSAVNLISVRTYVSANQEAVIEVEDNGAGISAEVRSRIFDPFFTTKPVGVGTGLGLSICHNLIAAMGGRIEVESERGKGSLFRIVLPKTQDESAPATVPVARSERALVGEQKILLIDDEPMIGESLRRVLSRGFVITSVNSAESALTVLQQRSFDVILCDLMMPGMKGMEFFAELSRQNPELCSRVGFVTGGAFTPAAREFAESMPERIIAKPFERSALLTFILTLNNGRKSVEG